MIKPKTMKTPKSGKLVVTPGWQTTHGFCTDMFNLYELYSNGATISENLGKYEFPETMKPLMDSLEIGIGEHFGYGFRKEGDISVEEECDIEKKNVVVAFSGGKDSVAAAMKFKEMGYNVNAFHLHGINRGLPNEVDHAREMANSIGVPFHVENVNVKGGSSWLEHPMKNQLICALVLDWSMTNGLGSHIAFGDFLNDYASTSLFDRNWSDTQEMWNGFTAYIRNYVPGFQIEIPFHTYIDTLDIITANGTGLLEKTQSCLTLPYRKINLVKGNESKYGVKLLPNRCGSCWKCCVEYIYLADSGKVPYNKAFYQHCLEYLKGKMKDEKPFLPKPRNLTDVYVAFLYDVPNGSHLHEFDGSKTP